MEGEDLAADATSDLLEHAPLASCARLQPLVVWESKTVTDQTHSKKVDAYI